MHSVKTMNCAGINLRGNQFYQQQYYYLKHYVLLNPIDKPELFIIKIQKI